MNTLIENTRSVLEGLQLKVIPSHFERVAEETNWEPIAYLYELAQREQDYRQQRRIETLLKNPLNLLILSVFRSGILG